jgi:hypothetical protein
MREGPRWLFSVSLMECVTLPLNGGARTCVEWYYR